MSCNTELLNNGKVSSAEHAHQSWHIANLFLSTWWVVCKTVLDKLVLFIKSSQPQFLSTLILSGLIPVLCLHSIQVSAVWSSQA